MYIKILRRLELKDVIQKIRLNQLRSNSFVSICIKNWEVILFVRLKKSLFWDSEILSWSLIILVWIKHILSKNKENRLPDLLVLVQPWILQIMCIRLKFGVVLNDCIHRIGFNFFLSLRECRKVESSAFIYTYNLSRTHHRIIGFKEKHFASNVDKIEYSW